MIAAEFRLLTLPLDSQIKLPPSIHLVFTISRFLKSESPIASRTHDSCYRNHAGLGLVPERFVSVSVFPSGLYDKVLII